MRGPLIVAVLASMAVWASGVTGAYGWFTDELYFLACAKRPALGYIDQPPLAPLLLAGIRALVGDTLWAIRLVPAALFAAQILLAARLARQLGGDRHAQLFAAILVATMPAFLVIAGFYSMNSIEVLLALGLVSVAIAIARDDRPRLWLAYGALVGAGFLNKHTIVVPGVLYALAAITGAPRHLATPWPYLGALVAGALAAPNLAWLARHDWVTLDFYAVSTAAKNVDTGPGDALVGQLLFAGPLGFACAIAGSVWLARQRRLRGFGAALFLGLAGIAIAGVSRPDRTIGLYPLALVAGAVVVARALAGRRRLRAALVVAYAAGTLVPLPLVVPVLPPPQLARYAATLGLTPQLERQKAGAMPQWMADRLGWPELARQALDVVSTLPDADRRRVALFGDNYGIAGALELYTGMPVFATHNGFWSWGPPPDDAVLVAVTDHESLLRRSFVDVRQVDQVRCELCFEDGTPIWIARGARVPLSSVWPSLLHMQ